MSDAKWTLFQRPMSSDVNRGVNEGFECSARWTLADSNGLPLNVFDASPSGF
jgi:hypothetical protein